MRRLRPEEWLARLTRSDPRKRKRALARVCELASADSGLLAVLRDALRSAGDHAAFWIVTDIGSLGPRGRVAAPELVRALGENQPFGLRQAILRVLTAVAPDEPATRDAVFCAFADPSPFVRRQALQAAIDLPCLSEADLGRIGQMEADPDEDVARWSEVALRNIRLRDQRSIEPPAAVDRARE